MISHNGAALKEKRIVSQAERRKERKFMDPNIARKELIVEHHRTGKVDFKLPPLSAVEFNLTGLCNRSCIFCPRSNPEIFPNVNEFFTLELYEKIMEGLQEMGFDGTILYSAFCEPLLHKQIEQLIRLSKECCPGARIEIVTNGDFVTVDKLRKLFKAGLSTLCISMYDGPHQVEPFRAMQREASLTDDQFILRVRYLQMIFDSFLRSLPIAMWMRERTVAAGIPNSWPISLLVMPST